MKKATIVALALLTLLFSGISTILLNVRESHAASSPIIATISVGIHPFEMAYDPSNKALYVTHSEFAGGLGYSGEDFVTVIDTTSNSVVKQIKVGADPMGVAYDPNNGKVYTTILVDQASGSGRVVEIDGATNTVTANISLSSYASGITYVPATGFLYVSHATSGDIDIVDPGFRKVVGTITTSLTCGAFGVAYDSQNRHLFASSTTCSNIVSEIDTGIKSEVKTYAVGVITSRSLAYDSFTDSVYGGQLVSTGELVFSIRASSGRVESHPPVSDNYTLVGFAFDSVHRNIYASAVGLRVAGAIYVLSDTTDAVVSKMPFGSPSGIAYDPDNGYVYVADSGAGIVSAISTSSSSSTTTSTVSSTGNSITTSSSSTSITSSSSSSAASTAAAILPQIKLFSIDGVTFQTGPTQLSGSFTGAQINIPSTTVSLYANSLKIGSFTFGLQAGIATAKGGEQDTLPGGGSAKAGDYLAVGSTVLGAQIDNLPPFAKTFSFTMDLTARGINYAVDKITDIALATADNVLLTFNPQLFCGVLPLNTIFSNSPCGGPMVVTEASPANLLVTSPSGKLIGTLANGQQVNQITNAWYSGANTEPQIVWIQQPERGSYNVTMIATMSGEEHYGVGTFATAQVISKNYTNAVSQGSILQASISISNTTITAQAPVLSQSSASAQQTTSPPPSTTLILGAVAIVVVLAGTVIALRRKHH